MFAVLVLLTTGEVSANNSYYDDGNGVLQNVFQADYDPGTGGVQSCIDCHLSSNTCDGGQSDYIGYDGVRACYSTIRNYLSIDYMPDGGPYGQNGNFLSRLTTWENAGFPLSPATVSGLNATPAKNSAVLGATFDTNSAVSGGFYFLEYGTSLAYGSTIFNNVTRNSTAATSPTGNTASNLACNTLHYYRARAGNGGGNSAYATGTFTTTICTAPIITEGATESVIMSEDSDPVAFSLTLNATDDDAGAFSWSIVGVATNGGSPSIDGDGAGASEEIGYTPPANYVGADDFQVRVTNTTTGFTDTITVNVTVNPVNDPPLITDGCSTRDDLEEQVRPTDFALTLNATDGDSAEANLAWTISSVAGNGAASTAAGTGPSNVITYAPDVNYNGGDIFEVEVSDGGAPDTITVNLTINARNDAPVIPAVGPQTGTEGILVTITPADPDVDDTNGSGQLAWSFVTTPPAGMTIDPASGEITWTPPLGPPAVFDQMYNITIAVSDGGEHHGLPMPHDTDSFTLEIDPPDGDLDRVADYDDLCLTERSAVDGQNFDNDGDGVAGDDGDPAAVWPLTYATTGGDVCDDDDDNDGISDIDEALYSLDPFDASDAALDNDGDGISNKDEIDAGTNPNQENLAIDATGYLTPYELVYPEPTSIHSLATAVTPVFAASITPVSDDASGPYRPGNNTVEWVPSNATDSDLRDNPGLVSNPPEQPFFVRPLLNFGVNQQAEEGATVQVALYLNGEAPIYPVTVDYNVSGTASVADYTVPAPISGSVQFNDTSPQIISFDLTVADGADEGETVVITLTSASNAAIGTSSTHTVTIVESNVIPSVDLQFLQRGVVVGSTYQGDGAVTINAATSDVNSTQTHQYDWSGTDNALVPPLGLATSSWPPTVPGAGNYLIDVIVTDVGAPAPAKSTRISRVLNVVAGASGYTIAEAEDLDGDGIPSVLDDNDGSPTGGNRVPDQTANLSNSMLLETDPGLTLRRGSTAQAAGQFGALLTNSDIELYGSASGTAPLIHEDRFDHVGGVYDFSISGLIPGSSARIVIPLRSAIPRDGRYRKYYPATGWNDFVVDSRNRIASAAGELGACPEPGSSEYRNGLQYLDNCVELTIEDGGPNDTDNQVNGIVNDPSSVGVSLTDPEEEEVKSGSGRVSPMLLVIMLMFGGLAYWRRQRGIRVI